MVELKDNERIDYMYSDNLRIIQEKKLLLAFQWIRFFWLIGLKMRFMIGIK